MITARQAFDIVRKAYPDKKCTVGVDHGKFYIFAMLDDDEIRRGFGYDPLYAVDKKSGKVYKYNLSGDEEMFFENLHKHPIHFDEMVRIS